MILTSNVPKKDIQFLFRLGVNSMKRLSCYADTELISVFSSITLNLQLYVDCTVSFLGCYKVEKRIDKSKKLLDLSGNMLMSVLLKLL